MGFCMLSTTIGGIPVRVTHVYVGLPDAKLGMESIVGHLDKHYLIRDSQHGFRCDRSCTANGNCNFRTKELSVP